MNNRTKRLLFLLEDGGRKTVSGVPPLIFRSDGSVLKNYRLYGSAGGVGDYDENSGKYVIPVTVSGKNLLNHIVTNRVIDQTLTVVVNNDRSITVNGASSSTQSINIIQDFIPQSGYTYILSGCPSGGSYSSYTMDMLNNNGIIRADSGNGTSFNADDRIGTLRIRIRIAANYTCNNLTFYPMIRLANAGNSAYEPYTESATINIFLDEPVYEGESVSMEDTGVHISTIDGTNILTVGTEVQPSKVEVMGKIKAVSAQPVLLSRQISDSLMFGSENELDEPHQSAALTASPEGKPSFDVSEQLKGDDEYADDQSGYSSDENDLRDNSENTDDFRCDTQVRQ